MQSVLGTSATVGFQFDLRVKLSENTELAVSTTLSGLS